MKNIVYCNLQAFREAMDSSENLWITTPAISGVPVEISKRGNIMKFKTGELFRNEKIKKELVHLLGGYCETYNISGVISIDKTKQNLQRCKKIKHIDSRIITRDIIKEYPFDWVFYITDILNPDLTDEEQAIWQERKILIYKMQDNLLKFKIRPTWYNPVKFWKHVLKNIKIYRKSGFHGIVARDSGIAGKTYVIHFQPFSTGKIVDFKIIGKRKKIDGFYVYDFTEQKIVEVSPSGITPATRKFLYENRDHYIHRDIDYHKKEVEEDLTNITTRTSNKFYRFTNKNIMTAFMESGGYLK